MKLSETKPQFFKQKLFLAFLSGESFVSCFIYRSFLLPKLQSALQMLYFITTMTLCKDLEKIGITKNQLWPIRASATFILIFFVCVSVYCFSIHISSVISYLLLLALTAGGVLDDAFCVVYGTITPLPLNGVSDIFRGYFDCFCLLQSNR